MCCSPASMFGPLTNGFTFRERLGLSTTLDPCHIEKREEDPATLTPMSEQACLLRSRQNWWCRSYRNIFAASSPHLALSSLDCSSYSTGKAMCSPNDMYAWGLGSKPPEQPLEAQVPSECDPADGSWQVPGAKIFKLYSALAVGRQKHRLSVERMWHKPVAKASTIAN